MKKCFLTAAALLAAGTLTLMGCGGGGAKPAASAASKTTAAPAKQESGSQNPNKIIVYTSMKESLISGLKNDFLKKNPDVQMDYQSAGAGSLMTKVAAERQAGHIVASVIWTSEDPDFYQMKTDGLLVQYKPKDIDKCNDPLVGTDDYFHPARLGTLGIVYNTTQVKNPPKNWTWKDITTMKDFKGAFELADPALSGTAFVSVAMLTQVFGNDFWKALKANGGKLGQGSGAVVNDTASGEMAGCIGVDYITNDKINKGATLKMAYPKEILCVPSPIGIMRDVGAALPVAKRFVDYMMSHDAQQIVANNGTLPVRSDVTIPAKYNLPTVAEAMKNGIKIDYVKMQNEREQRINTFKAIMQGQ
jgi:iron(III) transport system substrate-binding protein